ncbi:MAG TPA: CbiQ family ECF transporter T component [Candidatus Saccharimonadales bacterium]|nr:CbiQ family ECF transporter T component [Candidatus Saccharimonadales bacterium]
MRTARRPGSARPGLVLGLALALILAAALAPAGLRGGNAPAGSWLAWGGVFGLSLGVLLWAGHTLAGALRRVATLLPLVLLLAVPAGLLAPHGHRLMLLAALGARALAAATAAAALAAWLGPVGLVRGVQQLGLPRRLAEVFAAALAALETVTRQVRAMLRAREARRPAAGPWPALLAAPAETVQGFGRLVAALLLRSIERAEALDRARRARGAGEA